MAVGQGKLWRAEVEQDAVGAGDGGAGEAGGEGEAEDATGAVRAGELHLAVPGHAFHADGGDDGAELRGAEAFLASGAGEQGRHFHAQQLRRRLA